MTEAEETRDRLLHALVFNGITAASCSADPAYWLPLNERERFTTAVLDALRSAGADIRLPDVT